MCIKISEKLKKYASMLEGCFSWNDFYLNVSSCMSDVQRKMFLFCKINLKWSAIKLYLFKNFEVNVF